MPFANFKRVILHCGIHKTGSSYLQSVFASNRDLLAKNSILYPQYRTRHLNDFYGDQHSIVAMNYAGRDALWPSLAHFLDVSGTDCDTLLLSGEEFAWMYTQPDFFDDIKGLASQVTAVVYLRRFDHLIERAYSESVKVHLTGPVERTSYQLDFRAIVTPYIEALGSENVILRPYNERLWPGASLARDFFSAIGIPDIWPSLTGTMQRVNKGLPRPETHLLSLVEKEAEKASLLDRFKTSPVPIADQSLFFRSPDRRMQFNRGHALLIQDLENIVGDLSDFLDLYNSEDDPQWTPFDASNPALAAYLASFRSSEAA